MTRSDHPCCLIVGLLILGLASLTDPPTYAQGRLNANPNGPRSLSKTYGQVPAHFEANRGQTDRSVQFVSRGRGYALFLTPDQAVFVLRSSPALRNAKSGNPATGVAKAPSALRLQFLNTGPGIRSDGLEQLPGFTNYYLGSDPKKWVRRVPTFAQVRVRDLYEGVDLVYHANQGKLEFDLIVSPGADPKRIRLGLRGHQELTVDAAGDLVVRTEAGEIRLHRPYAFQDTDGTRQTIASNYVLRTSDEVGLALGDYDPNKPLVIDPVLSYSTYLGGGAEDAGQSIALDAAGNAYITGYTDSFDFPTSRAFQPTTRGGRDVFVVKLDATGTALLYATYVGGAGFDEGFGIAVDPSGNAFVAGLTTSADFPITPGSLQTAIGGGNCGGSPCPDGFVLKLDPQGSTLLYSTYLGGSGDDEAFGIAVDGSGNAHVTGQTTSTDFPVVGPFQPSCNQCSLFNADAFFAKLNAAGSALLYSTFLGGSANEFGRAIAVDSAGNAYIAGQTSSPDFPTRNPLQPSFGGGGTDAFVAKFDAASNVLTYATYLGGFGFESANGIAAAPSGNAFVTGATGSFNFPVLNAMQPFFAGGFADSFVTKIDPVGALVFSTWLGGGGFDVGTGIVVGPGGTVYVTGETDSSNFPTANPLQATCHLHPFGFCPGDAFVTILDTSGTSLIFSSYLGGGDLDVASGLAVDSSGNAYVTGRTSSVDFPTTAALQPNLASKGQPDAFVAKLDVSAPNLPPFASAGFDQVVECASHEGTAVVLDGSASNDPDGDSLGFTWVDVGGNIVGTSAQSSVTLLPGFHGFALTVNDGHGATATASVFVIVQDTTPPVLTLSTTEIVQIIPTATARGMVVDLAGVASAMDRCDPSPSVTSDAPALFPLGATTVAFSATDAGGNTAQSQLTVRVNYNFVGYLSPIENDGSSVFSAGRAIPVKFQLTAADGTIVSNAAAALQAFLIRPDGSLEVVPVSSTGASNDGSLFRFLSEENVYVYNLNTAGFSPGNYLLRTQVSDQTIHDVRVALR